MVFCCIGIGPCQEMRKKNLAFVRALAEVKNNLFELPTDPKKLESAMPKPQNFAFHGGRPEVVEAATVD